MKNGRLKITRDATGETWNHQGAKVAQPIMVNASPGRQGIMPGSRSGMDDKERLTLNNQRKDLVAQHESAVLFTEKKWGTDIGDFKGGPERADGRSGIFARRRSSQTENGIGRS